jgi:hypothetical protein
MKQFRVIGSLVLAVAGVSAAFYAAFYLPHGLVSLKDNRALVSGFNIGPIAASAVLLTEFNTPIIFELSATDPNPEDTLTFYNVTEPEHGRIELLTRVYNGLQRYVYTPDIGWEGTDTYTFKVTDGTLHSNTASVSILVRPASAYQMAFKPLPIDGPEAPRRPATTTQATTTSSITYRSYPLSVYRYAYNVADRPLADRSLTLQQALNKYKEIRLDDKNYTELSNTPITLTGSQKIFGLPHTAIPSVVVSNVDGAELRRLRIGAISFQGFVRNSTFSSIWNADMTANNVILEDNLFLDIAYGWFQADMSAAGYMRNNRFIRVRFQAVSPMLVLKGDPTGARASYNNVFVGFNPLTPGGDGIFIENQKDFTIVGMETEYWNSLSSTTESALFRVPSGGAFYGIGFNAGNGRAKVYNFNSNEFRLYGAYTDSHYPTMLIKNGVKKYIIANSYVKDVQETTTGANSFRVLEDNINIEPRFNNSLIGTLSAGEQSTLVSMINPVRIGEPWEVPTYEPVQEAPVVSPPTDWSVMKDDAPTLQEKINRGEIIPAGVYYIKQSLILGSEQMLWGAGPDITTIIAPSTVDVVRSSAHNNGPDWGQSHIVVGDITLQGGRSGIHLDAAGAGAYSQVTDSVISNVIIRDMTQAGIWAHEVYAMDNSYFDHVYIVNSNSAWKQTYKPGCSAVEEQPGTAYLDKNYFYASQFINNTIGWDLNACRSNNSNYAINSLFKNNKVAAAKMFTTTSSMFINSDFVGNGGSLVTPTISTQEPIGYNWSHSSVIVGSRFDASKSDYVLGAYRLDVEGSTFDKKGNSDARVVAGGEYISFYNTDSNLLPGNIRNGIFLNNTFSSGQLNNPVVYVKNFIPRVIVSGASTPSSQFLFGSKW